MHRDWAALVPELLCTDIARSVRFYCDLLGFRVRFERPEDRFAYLERGPVQLMLEQRDADSWEVAPMERPFGRGMNLQIEVDAVEPIHESLKAAGVPPFGGPQRSWYRDGDLHHGQVELLVQDPDGYLLRFVEIIMTEMSEPGAMLRVVGGRAD
ncbi:bleomycin resistance protein [Caulobacter mirabilis]|uniref:Bleomycin resistance protein n=1 Tax=Caulobacter mirabilis TaxID=69666 RepID=A0A2D2B0Y9_9CAUL|nr:VOC family protein [Caulobacter mirabilis]ATQ43909.1 aldoketomutase [Caulobacter mirabilis]